MKVIISKAIFTWDIEILTVCKKWAPSLLKTLRNLFMPPKNLEEGYQIAEMLKKTDNKKPAISFGLPLKKVIIWVLCKTQRLPNFAVFIFAVVFRLWQKKLCDFIMPLRTYFVSIFNFVTIWFSREVLWQRRWRELFVLPLLHFILKKLIWKTLEQDKKDPI